MDTDKVIRVWVRQRSEFEIKQIVSFWKNLLNEQHLTNSNTCRPITLTVV